MNKRKKHQLNIIKRKKLLNRLFGTNEYGFPDLPIKISGRQISRALIGDFMGCSYCFPHNMETINNKWMKDLKCWKRYYKYQWNKNQKKSYRYTIL